MNAAQPPVSQFNQMLVVSVFLHGMLMTLALFLPKMDIAPRRIQPAFRVQLVELPTGNLKPAPAAATASSAPQQLPERKVQPVPAAQPKPIAPPKPVKPPPSKTLARELDQVAALSAPAKPRVVPKPVDSFLEQQVKELEALKKNAPTVPVKPVAPLAPPIPGVKTQPRPTTPALDEKNREFESLVAAPVKVKRPQAKTREDNLLKELETISQLKTAPVEVTPPPAALPRTEIESPAAAQEIRRLKEQLASLKSGGIKVEVEMKRTPSPAPAYKSQIHSLTAPDPGKSYVVASVPKPAQSAQPGQVTSEKAGTPGADLLSLYIGEVEQRVLNNWKSPFGAKQNEVQAAFYIYPQGKIDRPVLLRGSGNDMLDNLALRAINDSAPFPPFPTELKEPNLHITIHFHYVNPE